MEPDPASQVKKTTQLTMTGGFIVSVVESLDDVAASLNDAAQKPGTLVRFTSAAFISGVSDQVHVNPAHVTMVVEMPGEAPPAGATLSIGAAAQR